MLDHVFDALPTALGALLEVDCSLMQSGGMAARSSVVLHSCASLRAAGIPLSAGVARARVVAVDRKTGRQRRVLTTQAVRSLTPDEFAKCLPCSLEAAATIPWFFDPVGGYLTPERFLNRIEIRVRLTAQLQRRGVRWLYVCPTCEQSTRHIYAVLPHEQDVHEVGCRSCLGLAYATQTHHRTRRGDDDIVSGRRKVSLKMFEQATVREEERMVRMARAVGYPLSFFENTGAVNALFGTAEIDRLPFPDVFRLPDLDFCELVNDQGQATDEEGTPS